MKKIILFVGLLLVVGCKKNNYESTMNEYATSYYNNHMSMISVEKVYITKNMINEASDEDGYDMTKLESCTSDSKVIFTIKDRKIVNTEYNLECE